MPVNQAIVLPAPIGMDNTNDPETVGLELAQQLTNYAADRFGLVRASPKLLPALTYTAIIDGITYYYGQSTFSGLDIFGRSVTKKQADAGGDRVLWITGGVLKSSAYTNLDSAVAFGGSFAPTYPVTFQAGQNVTGSPTFTTGQPLRSCQFQIEAILLQVGAASNFRYYINANTTASSVPAGTAYYQGLPTPAAPTGAPTAVGGGYVAKTGVIYYAVAYIDEFGRYSSPTAVPLRVDFGAGGYVANPTVTLSITLAAGLNGVSQIAFLGTIQGAPTTYYVLQDPSGNAAIQTYTGAGTYTFHDGVVDATVATGIVGPIAGSNDAPNIASWATVWKNRVVMNDLLDPNALQISNDGSPTQFSTLPYDPNNPLPSLGLRMEVDSDNGNPLTAGVPFGTLLALFKRKSIYLLYGDDASNFTIEPVFYGRGCEATDSAVRCEGSVLFLSDDGVYEWSGGKPEKISKEIEKHLLSYNLSIAGARSYVSAKAVFCNREYVLTIGADIYKFNFDTRKWSEGVFGSDANTFLPLTLAASINPTSPDVVTPPEGLINLVPGLQAVAQPNAGPNTQSSTGLSGGGMGMLTAENFNGGIS